MIDIRICSDEEAESVDAVVCLRAGTPAPFTDNIETFCAWCGHAIFHRPHAPSRPPKICIVCAVERLEGGTA